MNKKTPKQRAIDTEKCIAAIIKNCKNPKTNQQFIKDASDMFGCDFNTIRTIGGWLPFIYYSHLHDEDNFIQG
jgi:hypothetical protein